MGSRCADVVDNSPGVCYVTLSLTLLRFVSVSFILASYSLIRLSLSLARRQEVV